MAEANELTFEGRCIISCGMLHPEMTHAVGRLHRDGGDRE